MTKVTLREKARQLRRKGYSYGLIRQKVPVSKSTLSIWLADVPYTPNQAVKNRVERAMLKSAAWHYKNKRDSLQRARDEAVCLLGAMTQRDILLLGLGVYIGEGSKNHDIVRVINADPNVICLAIRWFEDIFGLTTKHFSIRLHLYPDNDIRDSIAFWSTATGIPKDQFTKVQVDARKKHPKKRGLLKYGTAHLSVYARGKPEYGSFLSRKIIALMQEAFRQVD